MDCGKRITEEIPDTMHRHAVESYTLSDEARVGVNAKESGTCKLCGVTVTREIPHSSLRNNTASQNNPLGGSSDESPAGIGVGGAGSLVAAAFAVLAIITALFALRCKKNR
jgi:hypothetical protein